MDGHEGRKNKEALSHDLDNLINKVLLNQYTPLKMDLDNVKSDLVTREFLAVLFAGFVNESVNCPPSFLPLTPT